MKDLEALLNKKIQYRKEGMATTGETNNQLENIDMESSLTFLQKTITDTKTGGQVEPGRLIKSAGGLGKLKILLKKAIGKFVGCYVDPAFEAQTAYNKKMEAAMEALEHFAQNQVKKNQYLEQHYEDEIQYLKWRIVELEKQLEEKE